MTRPWIPLGRATASALASSINSCFAQTWKIAFHTETQWRRSPLPALAVQRRFAISIIVKHFYKKPACAATIHARRSEKLSLLLRRCRVQLHLCGTGDCR